MIIQTKILLFGKKGQLGRELEKILSPNIYQVFAFSSEEVDVSHFDKLKTTIEEIKPQIIINASAYTAVDRAEQEHKIAMRINAEAPAVMAECAKEQKAVFVHYSTDYVFDGAKTTPYHEDDLTNPLNVYGKSKLKGEQAISQVGGAYIILRTSWVYSMRGKNFVTKILSWAHQKKNIRIVTDQIGSPTWAHVLAQVTGDLIQQSKFDIREYFSLKHGIYHLGGSGNVSRFNFAKEILRLGSKERLNINLEPALTSDFPTPAIRPLTTSLDCSRFETIFGLRLPKWQESLKTALQEYSSIPSHNEPDTPYKPIS